MSAVFQHGAPVSKRASRREPGITFSGPNASARIHRAAIRRMMKPGTPAQRAPSQGRSERCWSRARSLGPRISRSGFVERAARWRLMWPGTGRRRCRIVGLSMDPSPQLRGSGPGRCVETATGRFPAKPSARDWVSRCDFSENCKETGLLAVLHAIFGKSAAGDLES